MSDFVTGIHPRLHFWPTSQKGRPAGIRTEADLCRRTDPPADEYIRWLRDRILTRADAYAHAEPVIATNRKGDISVGARCNAAWEGSGSNHKITLNKNSVRVKP